MDGLHASAGWSAHVVQFLILALLAISFALLCARRIAVSINLVTAQALILSAICASLALAQNAPQLFIVAGVALLLKSVAVPISLRRVARLPEVGGRIDSALGIGPMLVAAIGIVALSHLVFHEAGSGAGAPQDAAASVPLDALAIACSVVLIAILNMAVRHGLLANVVAFLSIENGVILAMVSVDGMPGVAELSIASGVLVGSFLLGLYIIGDSARFQPPHAQAHDGAGEGGS